MRKAFLVLSGGMDSATLAYWLLKQDYNVQCLTFDYGQRHRREIDSARAIAERLGLRHDVIDISLVQHFLTGSSLTDPAIPVPHGHYHEENMRTTVVPNRNAIMLSIAWGVACSRACDVVCAAVHAGDHFIYPDCRPEFITAINEAFRLGTAGHRVDGMQLLMPFVRKTKGGIASIGLALGVPFELTWTCYEGGSHPCGQCGACNERAEAFAELGQPDPLLVP